MSARVVTALTFLVVCGSTAWAHSTIEYLYVDANEGQAAAGHVAMRFGPETFHFQHEEPGLIRIHRTDSGAFDYDYAVLENRSIHSSHIAVSDTTYETLREAFRRRLVVEEAQFAMAADLHREVELFEYALARKDNRFPDAMLDLPAVGWFLDDGTGSPHDVAQSPVLEQLGCALEARYGPQFLSDRIEQTVRRLRQLELGPAGSPVAEIKRDEFRMPPPLVSAEWYALTLKLLALQILSARLPLRSDSYWVSTQPEFVLTPEERRRLRGYTGQLQNQLVDLMASQRNDWGLALLLGMARLIAFHASLELGHWVVLRTADLPTGATAVALPPETFRALEAATQVLLRRSRNELFGRETFSESDLTTFEWAARRLLDLRRSAADGTALTSEAWPSLATRHGRRSDLLLPDGSADHALESLARARGVSRQYDEKLRQLYGYNLVERNCVSEIFSVIDAARESHPPSAAAVAGDGLADPSAGVADLGGEITTQHSFNFIPVLSARAVDSHYRVLGHSEVPSYRRQQLARMYRSQSTLPVYLRESNTLTSSLYTSTPADSPFLFFTDDAFALRPLFGVANLLVGLGATVTGTVTMPFDRGTRLEAGAKGILFSLPELFFVNIRKGSFPLLPDQPNAPCIAADHPCDGEVLAN